MAHFISGTLLISLLWILWIGCTLRVQPAWISKVAAIREPIGAEAIFRLPDGELLSFGQLLDELEGSRVIFMGESHDQVEHHRNQLRTLQGLIERKKKKVVVAMEMFERSQQSILDRWTDGELTEEEFLTAVNWERTWGMDFGLYRGILNEAKARRLKVLCLNIDRELVRQVAEHGVSGLSPEDKARLPEMDLSDVEHRRYIASIYVTHRVGLARDFERFYQAQCLWDEAMAETLFTYLSSEEGRGRTVLVIVGSGHVAYGFGIPKRLYRRIPVPYQTVLLKEWKGGFVDDFILAEASSPPAHFLWITDPSPPEKRRPRIGILLREVQDPKGIVIERVYTGSPAERAGLLSGDRIIKVGEKEIKAVKEIQEALAEIGWGKDVILTIIRKGQHIEMIVPLPPPPD